MLLFEEKIGGNHLVRYPNLGVPSELGVAIGGSGNDEVNRAFYTGKGLQTPLNALISVTNRMPQKWCMTAGQLCIRQLIITEAWAYILLSCNMAHRLHPNNH